MSEVDIVKVEHLSQEVSRVLGDAIADNTADEIALAVMMALMSTLARGVKPERLVGLLLKSMAVAHERTA